MPFSQQDPVTGSDGVDDNELCMVTDSYQYAFENAGLHVVPNWDQKCQLSDAGDLTTIYDVDNNAADPKYHYIKPFRNSFNGDDEPQLCTRTGVYACVAGRDCRIYSPETGWNAGYTIESDIFEAR